MSFVMVLILSPWLLPVHEKKEANLQVSATEMHVL